MSPTTQTIIVAVIIAGATVYMGWVFWKTFFAKKSRGCGCGSSGCSAKSDIERRLKKARKEAQRRAAQTPQP
ncbi:FeoB-associated Cys-rich membrane protein [bacterium]|nr:FeoB-associated Cys-rich membrane protein [bacterium]